MHDFEHKKLLNKEKLFQSVEFDRMFGGALGELFGGLFGGLFRGLFGGPFRGLLEGLIEGLLEELGVYLEIIRMNLSSKKLIKLKSK